MSECSALFVVPPVYDFALYDLFFKPYGLLRVAAWFKDAGYSVRLLNCLDYEDEVTAELVGPVRRKKNGTGKFFKTECEFPDFGFEVKRPFFRYGIALESVERLLDSWYGDEGPDVVVFMSGMTYWYMGLAELHSLVRRRFPDALTVVGGVYATLMPEHCSSVVGPDVVAKGDDTQAIRAALFERGLVVPDAPVPYAPLADFSVWRDAAVLRINAGCPFSCSYCASSAISSFSSGRGDDAYSLFSLYHRLHNTRNFAFYDDALLVNKEEGLLVFIDRLLCDYGSSARDKFSFFLPNAVHGRLLDKELASLMYRAGFKEVRIGFESADDEFHKRHDGKLYMEEFKKAVDCLIAAGFSPSSVRVYVLAGLPAQRRESLERSLSYLEDFPVTVSVAEYSPVPGTFLWEDSVRLSSFPLEEPLFHNNSLFPMQWQGFTADDLAAIKKKVRQRNSALMLNR